MPTYKFSTVILEEALRNGKIGNIITKKEMFDALLIMNTLNNLMDEPIYPTFTLGYDNSQKHS